MTSITNQTILDQNALDNLADRLIPLAPQIDSTIYVTLIPVRHIDGYPFPIYVKVAVVTIFRQFPLLSNRHNIAIW